MSFEERLRETNPPAGDGRRWIHVPYDQLTDRIGPLSRIPGGEAGIILVESRAWLRRRPYHRQKVALLIANMRSFALEQAARGVAVTYRKTDKSIRGELDAVLRETGPAVMMEAAEYELRAELAPLVQAGRLHVVPHEGWLTTRAEFDDSTGRKTPWRMDAFYRAVRRRNGLLMEDDKPAGGRFSHDGDNRDPWHGDPPAPDPPRFQMCDLRREVAALVEDVYTDHPGRLDMRTLPVTAADARRFWKWALDGCLLHFGRYEDAMSTASTGLFHTRTSALINIHRLLPRQVIDDALALDIPLNSKEGFLRQVIGWREYMKHIHDATDGLRRLPNMEASVRPEHGDGGYERWAGERWPGGSTLKGLDGGAAPAFLGSGEPLPPAWWGVPSGMHCLDTVVASVWDEAWSHHITRLMILSNIATLLDIDPRELADWFWVAYNDAYDWVVEPNVLGMGTFALGDLYMTKPYISGASYINRMSDYCGDCRFSPAKNCPIKRLYWAFLDRHRDRLDGNPRLLPVLRTLDKRQDGEKEKDRAVFDTVRGRLAAGEEIRVEDMPPK